jgi:diguanylate cyclase (GGDEF)-like protein
MQTPRPALVVGRILVAVLIFFGAAGFAAPENADQLLQRADRIKLDDNDAFQSIMRQMDGRAGTLTPLQHDWLEYLRAWQLGYLGEYPQAVAAFDGLIARTQDATVRARARISVIYDQVNSAQYEGAYSNLNALLDSLPRIDDRNTHFLVFVTAAYLYTGAGQYDLALRYNDEAAAYDHSELSSCIVGATKIETLYKAGKPLADDAQVRTILETCEHIGSLNDANSTRLYLARALLDRGRADAAFKMLKAHDAEVIASHSSALTADYRAVLARCALNLGNLEQATRYAQSALVEANKQFFAQSVADSYQVLYMAAKHQGDDTAALAWHEKYAAADKGYLNDVSARALAYQQVHQQVLDKQRQIDAANDKNKMLALQQQVDAQQARARLLYIGLLAMGLLIVVGWAYRTKRSQLKFQKLARRDGLTGIANRQHFFDSAQDALRYCARSAREASLLLMDLDHFKSINDMHGHAAGDEALRRVVAACESRLRSIDIFGRLGGEEFAILLPDCAENTAAARAEEMRTDIAGLPHFDAYADVLVTASFGVASSRVCGYNLTTLLAQADNALYQAKGAGRNKVVRYTAKAEPGKM